MKIFRKTREKLIKNKKIKDYLLYALGEIVLVVIGIYIALQLNIGQTHKKERIIEKVYLSNILSDLQKEELDLNAFIALRNSKSEAASRLIKYIEGQEVADLVAYNKDLWHVFQWPVHHANDNSFKELMNSGNLFKIKDNTIRQELLKLNAIYEQLAETREHLRYEYHEFLYEEMVEVVDYDLMWNAESKEMLTTRDSIAIQKSIDETKGNMVLKNAYVMSKNNNAYMGMICEKALKQVKQIIPLIEKDLEK